MGHRELQLVTPYSIDRHYDSAATRNARPGFVQVGIGISEK